MSRTRSRPAPAARRAGYVIAIVVNAVLLWLVDVSPGWQAVPFLTPQTEQVIGLVTLSLVVSVAVNVVYIAADPPGLRAAGEVVTALVGVVVALRVWQVFPFDVSDGWRVAFHVLLALAIGGGIIGALSQVVTMVRLGALPREAPR